MKKATYLILYLLIVQSIYATTYNVGPSQTYTELGDVPWISLIAGDIVQIHWRSMPYAEKIFLRGQGTEVNPIIIRGIPNTNGDLPVLTGENATTNAQFASYFSSQYTEDLSLFLIYRGPNDSWSDYKPKHLIIEYLEITGVKPEHTFTDQFGNVRNYSNFGTGICAIVCENLTIRHCKIHHNSQGIFTNTNGDENQISRDLLIEYNEIWDNGNVDDDKHHNIYAQAAGTIIQYNKIGSLVPGSLGSSLKDRSSGTIIRYNWIESSSRAIDLVECQEGCHILTEEPNYHDAYVYGNVIENDITQSPFASSMIHFGYDNSSVNAKRGSLFFYNNTVYIKGDTSDYWYVNLFDVTDDNNSLTMEGSLEMHNNIIHKNGTTNLRLMRDGGTIEFYTNNWLQNDYTALGYQATANVVYTTQPILGVTPDFIDVTNKNFELINSSSCVDIATSMIGIVDTDYLPTMEYKHPANGVVRVMTGSAFDIGAFEYKNVLTTDSDEFDTSVTVYPNPAKNSFTIKIKNDSIDNVVIYSELGQELRRLNTSLINISDFNGGIYFVKISTKNGKNVIKKMIKR